MAHSKTACYLSISTGQAEFVAGDHKVGPGVFLEPAYGHTPGNVMIHAEDKGRHAILCGDAIHHPVQLIHPEWSTNFCSDQARSRATRLALLANCAGTSTMLLPAHFQSPNTAQEKDETVTKLCDSRPGTSNSASVAPRLRHGRALFQNNSWFDESKPQSTCALLNNLGTAAIFSRINFLLI